MHERKPLSGIVSAAGGGGGDILDLFDTTTAADDFGPLPKGTYIALAVKGELTTAKTGTAGYTIEFRVLEGEHADRRIWMPKYLTPAAMPYTKGMLAKFGMTSKEHLNRPFPANRFVCKVTVTVRAADDGTQRNEVKAVEVIRVQEPTADPFAPQDREGGDE
jgi:hypothetical protein